MSPPLGPFAKTKKRYGNPSDSKGILAIFVDNLEKNFLPKDFLTNVLPLVSSNTYEFIHSQILGENSGEPIKIGGGLARLGEESENHILPTFACGVSN